MLLKILDVGHKQAAQDKNQLVESLKLMHPVGRVTGPQEIANAVVWLLSDRSSFFLSHRSPQFVSSILPFGLKILFMESY
jgi:NAD(P)-dependent dehydrogenase (short-subunit alcohol dehydrogenase family)